MLVQGQRGARSRHFFAFLTSNLDSLGEKPSSMRPLIQSEYFKIGLRGLAYYREVRFWIKKKQDLMVQNIENVKNVLEVGFCETS